MYIDFMGEHAREQLGMPEGWSAYQYEAIGRDAVNPAKLFAVKGAVAPAITKGKRKGRPNFRLLDKATERTAYFTPDEHDAWLAKWESETGKCHQCQGKGQEMFGWSAAEGTKYRECKRCNGTGAAPC